MNWLKQWRAKNPEWYSYASMMDRCYNRKCVRFKDYGGRGITVCKAWRGSYVAFRRDMAPRPQGTSLDRIDPSQGYSPSNCRWATAHIQAMNRRNTRGNALLKAWLTPQNTK